MTGYYTLKQGLNKGYRISVFLWDDFLEGENFRKYADVCLLDINDKVVKKVKKDVYKDLNGLFIEFGEERVYLHDFDFMPIDMLIKYMVSSKLAGRYISDDIIWATFMRDTDNIGVLCECPIFETIKPEIGDNYNQILCVPTESRRSKSSWGYKITFEPEVTDLKRFFASRDYYFSDFCSMLKDGDCILVNKGTYKTQETLK